MQKALIILGVLVAVLILLAVIIAMASGSKNDTLPLVSVAQTQQEIIRVSSDGAKNIRSGSLQNFAVTAQVSLRSSQQEVLSYLKKQGTKVKGKQLDLAKKPATDKALSAALAANTYDATFASVIKTELDSYDQKLAEATAAATTKKEQDLLQKQSVGAQLLRRQLTDQ